MVTLDFSKAFDVLKHNILLEEVNKAGIKGDAFKWVGDWLTGNDFQCRVKEELSKARSITSGCRQGSTLGPGLFLIFINLLLKMLPTECTYCYVDDITLIVPYSIRRKQNEEKLQTMLDECTRWSNKTGLQFNVKKCYILNLGNKRIQRNEFQLCGKIVEKAKNDKVNVLGVWFTGGKLDPMADMKAKTMRDGNLVFKRLRTYFNKSNFNTIKRVYNAYFTSKTLYGSEFFEDYTVVNNTYSTQSRWRGALDRMYVKMFAKKKPSKEDLINKKGIDYVVPLMPSQQSIVKSLVWAFEILSGKLLGAGIIAEKMLETNKHHANLITRSQRKDLFLRSTERSEFHNEKLSILKRHKGLIQEILGDVEYGEILQMSVKKQKARIENFVRKWTPNRTKLEKKLGKERM